MKHFSATNLLKSTKVLNPFVLYGACTCYGARLQRALVVGSLCTFLYVSDVGANDSEAELATGGLVLRSSESIEMESEDLYLSATQVRVKYVYRNRSKRDIKTIVAFPLPDADYGALAEDEYVRLVPAEKDDQVIPFSTKVDGKDVTLSTELRAFVGGREVTSVLQSLKLPLILGIDRTEFLNRIKALPANDRKKLLDEKILKVDSIDATLFLPLWRTTISIWREQIFPGGKTVTVEHSYSPITGGSVGNWRQPNSTDSSMPVEYQKDFCIDADFVGAVLKKLNKARSEGTELATSDSWVKYILRTGANWVGPIKQFTLTVDKQSSDSLVSFCGEGVKRVSPTTFQMTKSNFSPTEDLRVLFVTFQSFRAD